MDQRSLEQALAGMAAEVRFFEEIDSTNRVALEWAGAGAPEWSLVVSDFQSAGKGRFDRRWFAPPGRCLLFSVILRPRCKPEETPLLGLAASVALCRALEPLGLRPRVKWPNDVLLHGMKTAGILTQAASGGSGGTAVVVGVGVNVNVESFSPELERIATSILLATGRPADRLDLLKGFLGALAGLYGGFPQGIVEPYAFLCETLGRKVQVRRGSEDLAGTASAIDGAGRLILSSGEAVESGEVTYVRSSSRGQEPGRMDLRH